MEKINLSNLVRNIGQKPVQMQFVDNLDGDAQIEISTGDYKTLLKAHLVIICTSGEYSFKNSSGIHYCGKDSLCILVKDSYCDFLSVSDDCRLAVFETDTNVFHHAASSLPNLMLFYKHFKDNPSFELSEHEKEDALSIYRSMVIVSSRDEYQFKDKIRQAFDVALFFMLFAHVHKLDTGSGVVSARQNRIFQTFLTNVVEHFREFRKLDYYANLQFISVKHLSFAVKNESGITARQWITDFVMIEARELLLRKDCSVQEVSDILHFANQSFFGKFFKAHEGMSPLDYQKKSLIRERSRGGNGENGDGPHFMHSEAGGRQGS